MVEVIGVDEGLYRNVWPPAIETLRQAGSGTCLDVANGAEVELATPVSVVDLVSRNGTDARQNETSNWR